MERPIRFSFGWMLLAIVTLMFIVFYGVMLWAFRDIGPFDIMIGFLLAIKIVAFCRCIIGMLGLG